MSAIESLVQDDILFMRMRGDIGIESAGEFLNVIKDTLSVHQVVIDLSEAGSIDSLIVQFICTYQQTCLKFCIGLFFIGLDDSNMPVSARGPWIEKLSSMIVNVRGDRKNAGSVPRKSRRIEQLKVLATNA